MLKPRTRYGTIGSFIFGQFLDNIHFGPSMAQHVYKVINQDLQGLTQPSVCIFEALFRLCQRGDFLVTVGWIAPVALEPFPQEKRLVHVVAVLVLIRPPAVGVTPHDFGGGHARKERITSVFGTGW